MKYRLEIALVVFCIQIQIGYSQNVFSLGVRGGLGATVVPVHPEFKSNNNIFPVQTNPHLNTGIVAQYLIANTMGIESGLQLMYHSYSIKNGDPYFKNYFNNGEAIDVIDYQIPILLIYNIEHPHNASREFKIIAGTSVDWLTTVGLTKLGPLRSLKNIILSFRFVKNNLKYGRLEYSVEHQYALNRFLLKGVNYNQLNDQITTRTSQLTFSIYYFFWIKDLS